MIVSVGCVVTDKLESTERLKKIKTVGGMMKLHRAEVRYATPLELQLFVITAKHTHYVTLQLRLATLVVI